MDGFIVRVTMYTYIRVKYNGKIKIIDGDDRYSKQI